MQRYSTYLSCAFAFVALCITLPSCSTRCDVAMPAPVSVFFRIVDHSGKTALDSASLYWFETGNVKVLDNEAGYDLPPFRVLYPATRFDPLLGQTVVDSSRPVLSSYDIVSMAASGRASRFYIEYPNRSTDTIDLQTGKEDIGSKRCKTDRYYLSALSHNGTLIQPDASYISGMEVYPLHKY
jgi:hypothetical protein